MMHPSVRFAVSLILVVVFISSVLAGEDRNRSAKEAPPSAIPPAQQDDAGKRKYFTDLKLVTQDGKTVRFYSDILKDRVVLLSFFYINCKTDSPRQNAVLSRVQSMLGEHLGKDAFIVSISVDPEKDTPEKVKEYAKVFDAKKGWIYLTGKKENVDWVTYKLGQYAESPEAHSLIYLLGNLKTGHWLKVSKDAKAETLANQILSLVEENKTVK